MVKIHDDWRMNFSFTTDKLVVVTILAVLFTIIHLLGIFTYASLRKRPNLSGRLNSLTLAQTLGGFMIGMYQFYDYGAKYSVCAVQLWVLHFASLLYFMPVVCNCIRVLYVTSMGTEVLRGYAQEETKLFTTVFGKMLYHSLNSVYFEKKIKYPQVQKIEFPFWMNNNLRKYQLISRMGDLFFTIISLLALISLIIGAIIQAVGSSHRVRPVLDINNCVVGSDIYFIYIVILIFVLILTPIAIIAIRRVKESYGILSEAFYVSGINIWFIAMYIIWQAFIIPLNPSISDKFPAQGWIILMTIMTFAISVLIPIWQSSSKSNIILYDREKFNKMLVTQPMEWDFFEDYAISDFSFHMVVFELHMQELLENIYTSSHNNIMADNYVKGQIYIKYSEVIRIYFCQDSPFCLPLDNSWLNEIQEKLESTKVTVGIFDEARNFVNDSLFMNTYCKIPELRIETAKDDSGEFTFSQYLNKLQLKNSKNSKNSKQVGDRHSRTSIATSQKSYIIKNSIIEAPSHRISHEGFNYDQDSEKPSRRESQDSEKPSRRESAVANRRSFYPIGLGSNTNSVNIDSLIMPKDMELSSPYTPKSTGRETSILSGTGRVTHIMDQNSFTAVDITNSQQVRNIESLIQKYQTDSYPTDSLPDIFSDIDDGSGSSPSGLVNDDRKQSSINFPSSNIPDEANDPSPLTTNLASVRESQVSFSTLPYFIIEEGEEKLEK